VMPMGLAYINFGGVQNRRIFNIGWSKNSVQMYIYVWKLKQNKSLVLINNTHARSSCHKADVMHSLSGIF
jgi:hypothetical protein